MLPARTRLDRSDGVQPSRASPAVLYHRAVRCVGHAQQPPRAPFTPTTKNDVAASLCCAHACHDVTTLPCSCSLRLLLLAVTQTQPLTHDHINHHRQPSTPTRTPFHLPSRSRPTSARFQRSFLDGGSLATMSGLGLSAPGTSVYSSDSMYVGDGTWSSQRNTFLLPNLQGLNVDTMRYNGMCMARSPGPIRN